jgi:hypothetical protein
MIRKSFLLATLGIAWMTAACSMEPAAPESVSAQDVASAEQDITALCHVGLNGSEDFCTSSCTCGIAEGDCDSSTQCGAGLKCLFNVGANYGFPADVDVCDCPLDADNGGGSFCSAACPCSEGQGDCDSNTDPTLTDCAAGLRCYTDGGASFGLEAEDDVCATCLPAGANGNIDFCNSSCTCSEGEGDCDTNADCDTGLSCFLNVGADFGLPADTDVCAACRPASQNGHVNFCSASCQCGHGEGDCDTNADCDAGLTCVNNVGAQFGLEPDTDVCVDLTP